MPRLVKAQTVKLTEGRTARIREYDDGSLRLLLDDAPSYAIAEAFLTGRRQVIIKLIPLPDAEE